MIDPQYQWQRKIVRFERSIIVDKRWHNDQIKHERNTWYLERELTGCRENLIENQTQDSSPTMEGCITSPPLYRLIVNVPQHFALRKELSVLSSTRLNVTCSVTNHIHAQTPRTPPTRLRHWAKNLLSRTRGQEQASQPHQQIAKGRKVQEAQGETNTKL
jgi:hypothetical protein